MSGRLGGTDEVALEMRPNQTTPRLAAGYLTKLGIGSMRTSLIAPMPNEYVEANGINKMPLPQPKVA